MITKLTQLITDMVKKGTFCAIECYLALYVNCKKIIKNPIAEFIQMCTVINI